MAGIVFLRTEDLEGTVAFYKGEVGMDIWLEQAECTLLRHGNLLLGFCQGPSADTEGVLTFYYPTKEDVDRMYEKMAGRAEAEPMENERYDIYHFFVKDPEKRIVEFQAFRKPMAQHPGGESLLTTRRSVRTFKDDDVPEELLARIFELSRFSPTSMNSESYSFVVIRDREKLTKLAAMRGGSSEPIGRAPLAVAVVCDPAKSTAHRIDGPIAAYHFLLAAWTFGLGTCWIGSMDRPDAKALMGIAEDHFIACITPLGFGAEVPAPAQRRFVEALYRTV
jgi:nitroreductase